MQRKLSIENLEDRRVLATLIVNTPDDEALSGGIGDDDGALTLREAVAIVNGLYSPTALNGDKLRIDEKIVNGIPTEPLGTNDRIVFDSSVFGPNGTADKIKLLHGELSINQKSVVIDGSGYNMLTGMADNTVGWDNLTIDANGGGSVFQVALNATSVTIKELSVTGATNSGIRVQDLGASTFTLDSLWVFGNSSLSAGGGV